MAWANCIDCGQEFYREHGESWKKRCLDCWKAWKFGKDRETVEISLADLRSLYAQLDHYRALTASKTVTSDFYEDGLRSHLRTLIFLCHPDKHNGSKRASEATQWLLRVRDVLK